MWFKSLFTNTHTQVCTHRWTYTTILMGSFVVCIMLLCQHYKLWLPSLMRKFEKLIGKKTIWWKCINFLKFSSLLENCYVNSMVSLGKRGRQAIAWEYSYINNLWHITEVKTQCWLQHRTGRQFLGGRVRGDRPKEVEFKLHSKDLMRFSLGEARNWEAKGPPSSRIVRERAGSNTKSWSSTCCQWSVAVLTTSKEARVWDESDESSWGKIKKASQILRFLALICEFMLG